MDILHRLRRPKPTLESLFAGKLKPGDFVPMPVDSLKPDFLNKLSQLPFETSSHSMSNKFGLLVGGEFDTENKIDTNSHLLLHNHPQHGETTIGIDDLIASEYVQAINPGARSFLIHKDGITEYRVPDDSMDIRDRYSGWERKYRLDVHDELAWAEIVVELINTPEYIVQSISWDQENEIEKLASEMRALVKESNTQQ